ncbi:MAG TPA: NYN domain-containing protein [Anaerolineae bacterium]|nr:NYN domain-containing protein [Anaerolineae bacterium]
MPILVDGHNLIGRLPGISLADPDDEEALVRLLSSFRARTGKAITVVFDPGVTSTLAQSRKIGGVQVVSAPHGSTADAIILRRVAQAQNRQGLTVVTSDRELAAGVERLGARVQSAEAFSAQLGQPEAQTSRKEQPPSSAEVNEWLALFGNDDKEDGVVDPG